jgi:hypothetical protein
MTNFNILNKVTFENVDFQEGTGTIVFNTSKDDGNDYEFDAKFLCYRGSLEILDSEFHHVNGVPVDKDAFIKWAENTHMITILNHLTLK